MQAQSVGLIMVIGTLLALFCIHNFDKGTIWEIEDISPDLVFAGNTDTCITKTFLMMLVMIKSSFQSELTSHH